MQRTLEALKGEGIVRVRDRCGSDQLLKTHTKMELTVRAPLPPDRRPFFLADLGPEACCRGGIATVTLADVRRKCTSPAARVI